MAVFFICKDNSALLKMCFRLEHCFEVFSNKNYEKQFLKTYSSKLWNETSDDTK